MPRSRMHNLHTLKIGLFIVVMALIAVNGSAQDPSGPGLPTESTPEAVEAAVPWVVHPGGTEKTPANGPFEVHLMKLPSGPSMTAEPRTHEQGQFIQHGGQMTHELRTAPGKPAPEVPTPVDPEAEDTEDAQVSSGPNRLVANFDGIANSGWYPPDTVLAVGPTAVLEAVNSGFAVYSKTGSTLKSYTQFKDFFGHPSPWSSGAYMFDPRVIYSKEHAKFVMMVVGVDRTNQKSWMFWAISKTSDPTGSWCQWHTQSNFQSSRSGQWMDFPGMSADQWGIYFTGNFFTWANSYQGSVIWWYPPDPYFSCTGSPGGWITGNLTWPNNSQAFSLQPAIPYSTSADQSTYFVNSNSASGNQVLLWKLTGDHSKGIISKAPISINAYTAINSSVAQKGGTPIDGGDARVGNAIYSQQKVYTALGNNHNRNGDSSSYITVKLNVASNSTDWQYEIYSGVGNYYFYPAVTVLGGLSANPTIGTIFAFSSTTSYPGGSERLFVNGSTIEPAWGTGGQANYISGGGRNRWGDYSGAAYDWSSSPPTMWGAFEYSGTNNTWKTRIYGVTMQ